MLVWEKLGKARGNHGLDEIEIIHLQKKSTPDNSIPSREIEKSASCWEFELSRVKLYRKRPEWK